jgi:hypothetical protein
MLRISGIVMQLFNFLRVLPVENRLILMKSTSGVSLNFHHNRLGPLGLGKASHISHINSFSTLNWLTMHASSEAPSATLTTNMPAASASPAGIRLFRLDNSYRSLHMRTVFASAVDTWP